MLPRWWVSKENKLRLAISLQVSSARVTYESLWWAEVLWRMTSRRVSNSPRCHFDAVASKGVVALANAIIVLLVVPKITHASRTDLIRPAVVDAECCPLEVAPTRLAGRIDLNVALGILGLILYKSL